MQRDKLEALLRHMLADLQRLSGEAGFFRMRAAQIDHRVMELQHAIARLAYHSGVNPFTAERGTRQLVRRRTRGPRS
jgi:hypothetical protein